MSIRKSLRDVVFTCRAVTRREAGLEEGEQQEGESENNSYGNETASCAFVDKNIMSGCCHSVGRDE